MGKVVDDAPAQTSPTPSAPPTTSPIDLRWRGQVLTKQQVGRVYLVGSAAVLLIGIFLNYVLTNGAWYIPTGVQIQGQQTNSYLHNDPYDVFSAGVLVLSLSFLGTGFLAAFQPKAKGFATGWLTLLVVGLLGLWFLKYGATTQGENPLLVLTLGLFAALLLVIWLVAARIGPGARMHYTRAVGFALFGFYWATQAMNLYYSEEGDFVNAVFAMFGVFFFNYFAYHEIVSAERNEDPRALQWLSGTAFITTAIYFLTSKVEPIASWLILRVSSETEWLLHAFHQGVIRCGGNPEGSMIFYPMNGATTCQSSSGFYTNGYFPIQIILACTAIQSIMIFVGGIFALRPPRMGDGVSGKASTFDALRPTYNKRRLWAFLLTVPLIYVLNLFRNVTIIWMAGQQKPVLFKDPYEAFWFAHNVIGKGGSLVALIIIAFIVFQILPELYDSIIGLLDLKQRRGPLESLLFPPRRKPPASKRLQDAVDPVGPGAPPEPRME